MFVGLLACGPAAAPPQGPGAPARADEELERLPRVEASCPTTWAVVREPAVRQGLLVAAARLDWEPHTYGGPLDCGLVLERRCAPDLDGDGAADALVRLSWRLRIDEAPVSACTGPEDAVAVWPASAIVAAGRRLLGVVAYDIENGQSLDTSSVEDFVRLPDGRVGVRGRTTPVFPCDPATVWVVSWTGAAMERLTATVPVPAGCAE